MLIVKIIHIKLNDSIVQINKPHYNLKPFIAIE